MKLYTEATKGIISNSTQQIQKSLSPAITTLKAIVEDKDANIHARVSAARSLLEYGIRLTEMCIRDRYCPKCSEHEARKKDAARKRRKREDLSAFRAKKIQYSCGFQDAKFER